MGDGLRTLADAIKKSVVKNGKIAAKYLFGRPESLEDYVKIGRLHISRLLLARLLAVAAVIITVLACKKEDITAALAGKLWEAQVVVNTVPFHEASGKVCVYTEDGDVLYRGTMKDGRVTGTGSLYDGELLVYRGDFYEEKYEGEGILYGEDGKLLYEGGFADGVYEGEGTLYGEGGKLLYEGGFAGGTYEGEGTLYGEDGILLYEGGFAGGSYEGKGTLYGEDGKLLYEGELSGGTPVMGTQYRSDGTASYRGGYDEQGRYDGMGRLIDSDGNTIYEGGFAGGEFSGEGGLYEGGKLIGEGSFQDGRMAGEGIQYDPETGAVVYEGGFRNGEKSGSGKLYDPQTGRLLYEGGFQGGEMASNGTIYDSNGQKIYSGAMYQGEIDYAAWCERGTEEVRTAFGRESELVELENSFLMLYDALSLAFEISYTSDGQLPAVRQVILYGDQKMSGAETGADTAGLKEQFGTGTYSEYTFLVNEEDAVKFAAAGSGVREGDTAYSLKYINGSIYIRIYAAKAGGSVIFFEIGKTV